MRGRRKDLWTNSFLVHSKTTRIMAKKVLFLAMLCILSHTLFAMDWLRSPLVEPCQAPAPDSFRVTEIIAGDVQLAWSPAWLGAIHTLKIMQADSNGAWGAIQLYSNVPDSTFTLFGLEAGVYRALLSTNCDWNQPSQVEKDLRFKIIDLVVGGRVPISPSIVEGCTPIQMADHKWVGFRVRDLATGVSNIFEFTYEDGVKPTIKRVGNDLLVATDYNDNYPQGGLSYNSFNPVRMADRRIESGDNEIGYVRVSGSINDNVIEICIEPNAPPSPWKPQYQLTTLTSAMPTAPTGGGGITPQGMKGVKSSDSWLVQNPICGTLTLFPPTKNDGFEASVTLLNIQGDLLWNHHLFATSSELVFPTHYLPSGNYILHIKTAEAIQTFKIQKI